ncbi:hypothetical protein TgHK011_001360 [Trichoderma gracile]|nr:hypothetical protein TgHK011_001360 [Trichoderma gracile]
MKLSKSKQTSVNNGRAVPTEPETGCDGLADRERQGSPVKRSLGCIRTTSDGPLTILALHVRRITDWEAFAPSGSVNPPPSSAWSQVLSSGDGWAGCLQRRNNIHVEQPRASPSHLMAI